MTKTIKILFLFFLPVLLVACSLFQENQASKEEEASLRAELGMEYMKIRQFDKAVEEWRGAMKLLPQKYYYLGNNIGIIYFQEEKFDLAEKEWNSVLEQDPKNSLAMINLGNLYQKKKDYTKAEDLYKKVIQIEPNYYLVYTNLGSMYMSLGRYEEAIAQLKIAEEKNSADMMTKFLLGFVYRRSGDPKNALTYLEAVRSNQPENPDVLYEMGLAYDQLDDLQTSIQYLQDANKAKPDNPLISNALGYGYAKLGQNLDEAESLILQAIKSNPPEISQKINFQDSLSWVYFQKGEYQKAFEAVKKALNMVPQGEALFNPLLSEVNYHLGMISFKLDQRNEAKEAFNRSLGSDPKGSFAKKSEQAIQDFKL